MDAVELARQRAAELHNETVQRGVSPWDAYEFAVSEASHQGYDVEGVAPGGAMLDGGRAKLLSSSGLILHEQKGSLFEKALLVAHELGHALLGDADDATPANEMDFARSSEPSPMGEDRVLDYSRKQRREIQMDLFAREYLLPRAYLRKLYLEEGMTAEAVAEKLEAPYEVVAQQLLDALLLPVAMLETPEKKERSLNDRQELAASHRGHPYLLEAGPGTGKTQTLVSRVEKLLADDVDPRRILLLTFSNKAAAEMAERIAQKQPAAAAAMWVGTFHAFGLDIVRRFYRALGRPSEPRMLDRTEAVELLEQEFPRLDLQYYRDLYDPTDDIAEILTAISRAKDEVVGPEEYETLATQMLDKAVAEADVIAAHKALEVARVYYLYERLKQERNSVDFGDLVYLPVKLLEADAGARAHLASAYDHILVDEYQDVNRSSVRLLQALCPTGQNLWVVGDAKQSIYRFRGASSFNVARFGSGDFRDATREQLEWNYRSVGAIVQAYSNFACDMRAGGVGSKLEPFRKEEGVPPELRITSGADEQTLAIAECIEELKTQGFSYRDQAVLCTGNGKLAELARCLELLGVPVLFLGSLFERSEVKDLLSFLSLLQDSRAMGLVRLACLPAFQMEIQDVAHVLGYMRRSEGAPLSFLEEINAIPGLSQSGVDALARLRSVFVGLETTDSPWNVLATILLDRTQLAGDVVRDASVASRAKGIAMWQFMNFVKSQPAGPGLRISRLLVRIRRLLRLSDDRDLRKLPVAADGIDAVRLTTIHGAKGLEFRAVHIPGLNEDTLPGRRRPTPGCPPPDGLIEGVAGTVSDFLEESRAEEQECLFYVAMSRAEDRLMLYACTKDKALRNRKLSENFLARLGSGLVRSNVVPKRSLPESREDDPVTLDLTASLQLTEHQMALYERCPRRFLYTHVLQTGGRRTVTPFLQMHDAVRDVYKKVVTGEIIPSGEQLEADVEVELRAQGLGEHGYFSHYREFAVSMIRFFAESRTGLTPMEPTALRVRFGAEEIVVTPDDVLVGQDGVVRVRRVMTGHSRSDDEESIAAAAFLAATQQAFPHAIAELVYLADERAQSISLTEKKMGNRRDSIVRNLGAIRSGQFPTNASSRSCPNCPALFVCGPVPSGRLQPEIRQVVGEGA
ncbi:UvrD-helicase domain-containing protein [Burkholderia pseudomallei]|uniref:UvrD-helicase domain-containing protein n=5 Tax=Burkholderia pseudomallei TaxID=28450 RepID=UPI0003A35863|nr:UvrD-helicase domain-containing protein [Burkholderia pseudomallei]MBF3457083.1 UvrD-helicase domain-containing protein [Burkholderia pseudomallei]MBF3517749.1 UvrD-helicase domain-containing protein [Burkholderia pseudomallei]MBF3585723.1 UvrD-helicase domain-containing protein [Burkholderia pseudomallei]MBF3598072.1 UvrD-helicase domain-containing protein [Burkholderia pseudomallei]MBF3611644.1 UvrD-helicase domain-containing protein [Burkholderia pseudomallei]